MYLEQRTIKRRKLEEIKKERKNEENRYLRLKSNELGGDMPRDKRVDAECQRMEKERETKEDNFLVQAMMMDRVGKTFL